MPDVLQIQRPDVGKDNDPEWPTVTYGGNPPRRKADGGRVALPWQALIVLLAGLVGVVAFGWWRYDAYCGGWANPCWWHGPVLASALVLIPIAAALGRLYTSVQRWRAQALAAQLEAEREGLVKDRYGENEPVWIYQRPNVLAYVAERAAATRALEEAIAPHKRYSGIETLNEGASSRVETNLGAPPALPEPVGPTAPQLPAGPLLLGLRQKAHRSGEHILVGFSEGDSPVYLRWGLAGLSAVVGGSGSGKTSTMRLMAAWHAMNGGALVILDPHGRKDEGLVNTIKPLESAFLFEPAVTNQEIIETLRAVDRLMRRRLHAEEPATLPILVICEEMNAIARNHPDAREIINLLMNFADEYRGVNGQALTAWHHTRGDVVDPKLGASLRGAIGTRIIHRIAPNEAKLLLTAQEAQGIDRLPRGEALFFDGGDAPVRIVVPFLDDRALAEGSYPQHAGWPLPLTPPAQPAPSEFDALADRVLAHFGGDRERAALALLATKGTAVRGKWAHRVRDIRDKYGLKNDRMAELSRRAGRDGPE